MKILAFVITSLLSLSAFADFTGTWQGKGTYEDGTAYSEMCSKMTLELAQTPKSFSLKGGAFECESMKITWKPFAMTIQDDGQILDPNGQPIGNADDTYFYAKITDPAIKLTGIYQLEITDAGLEYKQTTMSEDGSILFTINGLMTK